jgi:hypothetical protein
MMLFQLYMFREPNDRCAANYLERGVRKLFEGATRHSLKKLIGTNSRLV